MTKNIPISKLHPHPKNPRFAPRQEVVDQIAAAIVGSNNFDEAHALIVRPNAKGFEIVSGHHRVLAAEKAGLESVPCWVREMSDEEAYMALVLNNVQSELTSLERGMHALMVIGKDKPYKDIKEYAAKLGRSKELRTVQREVAAAEVATNSNYAHAAELSDCFRCLAEIHAAPQWLWPALVTAVKSSNWSTDVTEKNVKKFAKAGDIPEWADWESIAVRLIEGAITPGDIVKFSTIFTAAEDALDQGELESAELKAELLADLEKISPVKLSEVEEACAKALNKQAVLIAAAKQKEIEELRQQEEMAERIRRWRKFVLLDEWKEMDKQTQTAVLASEDTSTFTEQTGPDIEWAQWSWNPITGCLHDCPYCYARDIADQKRMEKVYPYGFAPTLHPNRLNAPQTMTVPPEAKTDTRYKNVFTGSMADIFGRWVPAEWIEAILESVRQAKQWNFLFLTKFPGRMAEFDFPPNAWVGTTVDLQMRVAAAEKAFAKVNAKVKWLSLEPMLEPLKFKNLDLFNWIVVGGASKSTQTPEWHPPAAWVFDLYSQAKELGIPFYAKTNLLGSTCREGMLQLPFKAPVPEDKAILPKVFNYLGKKEAA